MATATVNIPTQVSNRANLAAFPVSGAIKTLYIAEDTNKLYRWTGVAYVEVSQGSLGGVTSFNSRTGVVLPVSGDYAKSDVGLSNVDNTTDLLKPISTATQAALDSKVDENTAITGATKTKITYDAKGLVISGADASLAELTDDATHRVVTDAQIATWNALIGGSIFQTTWNASTNAPALVSSVGTKGFYYIVDTNGATNLNGITDWKIGDWTIYDGSVWRKVDNTDAVSSVNSLTGAVVLDTSNVNDTLNKRYVSDANLITIGNQSGVNTGDETAARIGVLINGSSAATPNDADLLATSESSVLKKITWTNVKAFLKTYFDTIYTTTSAVASQITTALTAYATQSYVNSQGFITNVIASLGYTPANKAGDAFVGSITASNLSGTNTGDNATNTQYSGLVSNANHTGDATGATALTLATVNSNVGNFGSASQTITLTVNGKGLVTAASQQSIVIAQSQVTNLTSDLALKATLVSPTFTGNPLAPTPTTGDNDTSIATTAFVTTAVANAAPPAVKLFNYYGFI